MSDNALSQEEIDALLTGGGGSEAGGAAGGGAATGDPGALKDFLASAVEAESANLSTMTGAQVTLKGPEVSFTNRDGLLGQLPDTVTAVKADFSSGFPGEHLFLLPEEAAKALASLINKEENITLDEMVMSVLGEAVSQLVGTQITALSDKTGNKAIASVPPEAANVPKAAAALPAGEFAAALYTLELGDDKTHQMWEVYGPAAAQAITQALSGGQAAPGAAAGGGGGAGGGASVQPVQFPSLTPKPTAQEQGNIGLLMDVKMEMTVELGRTKKSIKDILGMGEGTIIELDKLAGEPVDILVNHKLIAKGEVVVIDENFGVRVTEIVSPAERLNDAGE